jgi:hypothetical protein
MIFALILVFDWGLRAKLLELGLPLVVIAVLLADPHVAKFAFSSQDRPRAGDS